MEKIDCFAHVLLPGFKSKILEVAPRLPEQMPFINHPLLIDMEARRKSKYQGVKQVLSYVNTNPEDYLEPDQAIALVQSANQELVTLVSEQTDIYAGAVAMLALNNISGSVKIIKEEVARNPFLLGIQLFTRHLGKSLAHPDFKPIFQICAELDIPIWLHPVFDTRKPDNNIIFSWEYEQTQAMFQVVEAGYFQEFPELKIIVHHAGAMAPYFAERINHILSEQLANDFKKFYVDTALLGNPKALELAVANFGADHLLFGTDAPLGIAPAGATAEIIQAIEELPITEQAKEGIFQGNFMQLIKGERR
ncbi:MAG: amidohydrolase family protein [Streptococcus parauberis]